MNKATFFSVIKEDGLCYNFNPNDVFTIACYTLLEMEWHENLREAKEWLSKSEDAALLAKEFIKNYRHDQCCGISNVMKYSICICSRAILALM